MRMFTRGLAAAVLASAAAGTAVVGTAGAATASSWAGCADGAVCVYPQNQDPAKAPSGSVTTYGVHKIYRQYGKHWVLNNQTGGAKAELCRGANGTDCVYTINAQSGVYYDLGPINSIKLDRP